MLGEEVPNRYDAEISTKNGTAIPIEINAGIIEYEDKPATMAVVRDMTEKNKMWAALRDRENQLSLIYDNVSDVIYVIDVEPGDNYRFQVGESSFPGSNGSVGKPNSRQTRPRGYPGAGSHHGYW